MADYHKFEWEAMEADAERAWYDDEENYFHNDKENVFLGIL